MPKWSEKKHHSSSYSSFNEFYNEVYNTDAVTRLNIYMCFNRVCVCVCVRMCVFKCDNFLL